MRHVFAGSRVPGNRVFPAAVGFKPSAVYFEHWKCDGDKSEHLPGAGQSARMGFPY
jgi:hypothetical protein